MFGLSCYVTGYMDDMVLRLLRTGLRRCTRVSKDYSGRIRNPWLDAATSLLSFRQKLIVSFARSNMSNERLIDHECTWTATAEIKTPKGSHVSTKRKDANIGQFVLTWDGEWAQLFRVAPDHPVSFWPIDCCSQWFLDKIRQSNQIIFAHPTLLVWQDVWEI